MQTQDQTPQITPVNDIQSYTPLKVHIPPSPGLVNYHLLPTSTPANYHLPPTSAPANYHLPPTSTPANYHEPSPASFIPAPPTQPPMDYQTPARRPQDLAVRSASDCTARHIEQTPLFSSLSAPVPQAPRKPVLELQFSPTGSEDPADEAGLNFVEGIRHFIEDEDAEPARLPAAVDCPPPAFHHALYVTVPESAHTQQPMPSSQNSSNTPMPSSQNSSNTPMPPSQNSRKKPSKKRAASNLGLPASKLPKLSEDEQVAQFSGCSEEGEFEYTVKDLGRQFERVKSLTHKQSVTLFNFLVAFLYIFPKPNVDDKAMVAITVHAVAQLIEDLATRKDDMNLELTVEPSIGSTFRNRFSIPVWVAEGLKLYYLAVRERFLPRGALQFVRRVFGMNDSDNPDRPPEVDPATVVTSRFFVNSVGNTAFRASHTAARRKETVKKDIREARLVVLDRITASMVQLPDVTLDPNMTLPKPAAARDQVFQRVSGYKKEEVRQAVSKRLDHLRYTKACLRAESFLAANPTFVEVCLDRLLSDHYTRCQWENNDFLRVRREIMNMSRGTAIRRPEARTNSRAPAPWQRRMAVDQRRNKEYLSAEAQTSLMTTIVSQEWPGVTFVNTAKLGRSLMSIDHFEKDDILVDYHGKVVTGMKFSEYLETDPAIKPEYCIEVRDSAVKRIVDASSETCQQHPRTRCLGRLANHSKKAKNAKVVELVLDAFDPPRRVLVLRALRKISPFEHIMFDYGDSTANALFKASQPETEKQR